ncbi:MAG: recombinase family protein [Devosia sp.]|nr:recombinase family protein [Devosia sp.]
MVKAYSYIRFSTPEQSKGDSLRRQLDGAREWCAARGIVLDDSLRDLGRSAYKGGHAQIGALREFLDLVERGEIERGSYLIVESLDRLSREAVIDAAARLFDLVRAGITVVTLSDAQEYSQERLRDDLGALIISITIMARAHEESRIKGQRVGKAWEEKRRRAFEDGQAMTAICPAWLVLVGGPRAGRYEIVPERAEIVRGIFADTIAGLGRRSIAKRLNAAGIETWGTGKKQGVRWHDSYIQKILGNPATFGQFQPLSKLAGGDGTSMVTPIPGYYPAVVPEANYYAAAAASKARGAGRGRVSSNYRNILSGLVKCGTCSGSMVFIDKGQRSRGPKLTCGAAHASAGCDHRAYHPYYELEGRVLQMVGDDHLQALAAKDDTEAGGLRGQIASETARRAALEAELGNLVELVAASGGAATVGARVQSLDAEVTQASIRLEHLQTELRKTLATTRPTRDILDEIFAKVYSEDDEERRRARAAAAQELRRVIDTIDIEPDGHFNVFLTTGETLT